MATVTVLHQDGTDFLLKEFQLVLGLGLPEQRT